MQIPYSLHPTIADQAGSLSVGFWPVADQVTITDLNHTAVTRIATILSKCR